MTAISPEKAANLAELVSLAAERGPDYPAFVDAISGDTLSWSEVDAAVNAHAAALVEAGVRPGDRVAVRLATGASYCLAVFGALRVGAVVVPMSLDLPGRAVRALLADCSATVLVGDPGTVDPDAADMPPIRARVLPAPGRVSGNPAPVDTIGGGEDIAVLCYTSGTSGVARGVLLSHRALLANIWQCAALRPAPVTAADRVLLALPLSHAYGLGPGLFQVTAAGATLVLLPRFGVDETLSAIEQHRVTAMVGVPPMYSALLGVPEERLRSALVTVRLFTSGAAALDPGLSDEMRRITGVPVYEGYGMTETGPVLTSTLVTGYPKAGSVGRALPGVELRLVDTDGEPMPEDDDGTGLVSVRGDNLFSGYWPKRDRGPDAEGWFRTGDIGYLDEDGDLHLVERANDLIIVNGFNVFPHEVEHTLAGLAGVAESAAVGVPDERSGEAVKVIVVPEPGATITADDVVAYCAERLARFKVPSQVEFANTLPHSATGKLARRLLR